MSVFASMLGLSPQSFVAKGRELATAGRHGEARLEFEKALELVPASDAATISEIEGLLRASCDRLAATQIEIGSSATQAGDFDRAINAFQAALDLLPDQTDPWFEARRALESAKKDRYRARQAADALPFIERGEAFLSEANHAEALVEFRQAMQILKFPGDAARTETGSTSLPERARKGLLIAEEGLATPYLASAKKLIEDGLHDEAIRELEAAAEIFEDETPGVDARGTESRLRAEIGQSLLEARRARARTQPQEEEAFLAPGDWDQVMSRYQSAISDYFSYSASGVSFEIPANPFEPELEKAKHALGTLYIKRADGHFLRGKFAVALKYYVEAQNFFGEDDTERVYLSERIDECKRSL